MLWAMYTQKTPTKQRIIAVLWAFLPYVRYARLIFFFETLLKNTMDKDFSLEKTLCLAFLKMGLIFFGSATEHGDDDLDEHSNQQNAPFDGVVDECIKARGSDDFVDDSVGHGTKHNAHELAFAP